MFPWRLFPSPGFGVEGDRRGHLRGQKPEQLDAFIDAAKLELTQEDMDDIAAAIERRALQRNLRRRPGEIGPLKRHGVSITVKGDRKYGRETSKSGVLGLAQPMPAPMRKFSSPAWGFTAR